MKFVKKAIRSAKKAVKKRYGIGKNRPLNMTQLATDVARMVSMINAEKKFYNTVFELRKVGQTNANLTGALCYDITPILAGGAGVSQRIGNSVKFCSSLMQFQITQESALSIDNNIVIEFWYNKGQYQTEASARDQIFQAAQWSGVVDYNSARNQDFYGDYRCFRKIVKKLPAEQITSDSTVLTFDVPIRFNRNKGHHVRYVNTVTGNLTDCLNGQMFCTLRAQVGNADSVSATTLSTPIKVINSGALVRFASKYWFYDN